MRSIYCKIDITQQTNTITNCMLKKLIFFVRDYELNNSSVCDCLLICHNKEHHYYYMECHFCIIIKCQPTIKKCRDYVGIYTRVIKTCSSTLPVFDSRVSITTSNPASANKISLFGMARSVIFLDYGCIDNNHKNRQGIHNRSGTSCIILVLYLQFYSFIIQLET